MSKYTQPNQHAVRHWQLHVLLVSVPEGATVPWLARTLGVAERTVERDLGALRASGCDIAREPQGDKTVRYRVAACTTCGSPRAGARS